METTKSSSGNKTIWWVAGGCIVVLVCVLVLTFSGVGGLVWLGSQSPDNVSITLNVPIEINAGESFEIEVTITNTTAVTLELNSIDFSMNYLTGFLVEETTPPYTETRQYDDLGGGETFQTYYFRRAVTPGETLTIVFKARALTEGDYRGSLDVCIDSEINCKSDIVRTVVK